MTSDRRHRPARAQTPSDGRPATESFSESSADRSTRLAALIRAEIDSSATGRITFARFMERALYEPGLGYYRQPEDRPTDTGDFLTAPETHPIFGWTVARRVEAIWTELGRPSPFDMIEYGAGSGTLALSILDRLRRRGSKDLIEVIRYTPIESNPYRLAGLHQRFERAGVAGLLATSDSQPATEGVSAPAGFGPVTGVILANEFLDAMPVNRIVVRAGRLLELYVAWREGFVEVTGEPSTLELEARFADDENMLGQLAEGQVAEICLGLGPWLDDVSRRLSRGYVLVFDYGFEAAELYGPRRLAGTLLGYRSHRVQADPFDKVGLTDLTAHVDFTALRLLGERRGLRSVAFTTQSDFLVAAGLESELQAFQTSPETTATDYLRARSGIVRLLDPRHMGRFRVLTLAQ
jgi:SAM-dependent MidA family methyltransferase